MGTSVASALTAETIFEITKYISDVDMCGRGRMGSKSEIFRFFNSGYAHDRNISIFRCRASRVTGNMLIKPNYASVRQSRDLLHRDRHNMTKKVAAAPCSETAGAKRLKKFTETCFVAHYYACKFGSSRLRIDGDIWEKAAITAVMENVVIAIYRLRLIQKLKPCLQVQKMDFCLLWLQIQKSSLQQWSLT